MIRSTESDTIQSMTHINSIFGWLIFSALLVSRYSEVIAQPPLISPRSKLKSLQAPAIEPRRNPALPDETTAGKDRDAWFLIEYDGATIGYESLTTTDFVRPDSESENSDSQEALLSVRRIRETHLKLNRFGNDLSVSAHLETVETVDGMLKQWSLRRTAGDGSTIQRSAVWDPSRNAFLLKEVSPSQEKAELLPSHVQPRSPILSAWLDSPELQRPQQWASAVLFPETSVIADVEIRRLSPQSLRLKDGTTIAVTRYEYWPSNQPDLRSILFYDSEQQVVLIEQPLLGRTLRFHRTDAATAFGEENLEALDLQFLTGLPLRRPLLNLEKSSTVRMLVSVGESEQISLPSGDFQTVEQTVPHMLIITLSRPAVESENLTASRTPRVPKRPDRKFTDNSRWLNSKDDDVRRMAVIGGGAVSEPHEKCRRLTSYVASHVRLSAFSTSLRPASEVAKSRQGDCTEFAVLLAALMRSEGVPSRVAVGFAYVPNPASLAPHMWTEAWIDGQWIPFDATLGVDVNPLTRVKVTDSALTDSVTSGTLLFVPLLKFMGRATVEILPEKN